MGKQINIYLDTEFTGLHQDTTLISLGMVTEKGDTFYAEFTDYTRSQIDEWIDINVIKNLRLLRNTQTSDTTHGACHVEICDNTPSISIELTEWLEQLFELYEMSEDDTFVIVSDCCHYDIVLLFDLWGGALSVPPYIYYIPIDICTMFMMKNIDNDINREAFAYGEDLPDDIAKHNALWDAKVIKACYENLTKDQ